MNRGDKDSERVIVLGSRITKLPPELKERHCINMMKLEIVMEMGMDG